MNIAGMLRRLPGKKVFTVTRESAGSYDEATGLFTKGPVTTLRITGNLQPAGPDDMISVAEGDRDKVRYRFYSVDPLRNLVSGTKNAKGDRLSCPDVDNGAEYEVETVENWPGFTKAIIMRVNTNEN